MGLNRLEIIGNLGRDAELRFTGGGMPVLGMNVAVNTRRKGEDQTTWVKVAVFGDRAKALGELNLTKGTLIYCAGPAAVETWEAKDGTTKADLKLIAFDVELLGGKRDGGQRDEAPRSNGGRPPKRQESEDEGGYGGHGGGASDDDGIPFLAVDERLV